MRFAEGKMVSRFLQLLLVAVLATGSAWAANSPFVGDWKLNPSKSRLTDKMKIESLGGNRYAFDFGTGSEAITIDGTDQPTQGGTTLSVTVEGPDAWKVIRKKDGHMIITANWKLSRDGNSLTDDFTSFGRNGAPSNIKYVYKRSASGSGFAGTWVSTSEQVNFVYTLQIRPYEGDGLSIIDAASQLTRNVKLDGKDYPNAGANAAMLATSSVKKVDERSLELIDKKKDGKPYGALQLRLSSDLRTLTITPHSDTKGESNLYVFERQ